MGGYLSRGAIGCLSTFTLLEGFFSQNFLSQFLKHRYPIFGTCGPREVSLSGVLACSGIPT